MLALAITALGASLDVTSVAGGLASSITGDPALIDELKVSGVIDVRDIDYIRENFTSLKKLDLTKASIAACELTKADWMNRRNFQAGELPAYSFSGFQVEDVLLPSGLQSIGDGAFSGSGLKSITFPSSLVSIGNWAFSGSMLREISLPRTHAIGEGIFRNCTELLVADLSELEITVLPYGTFAMTPRLMSVDLPATLKTIGSEAFLGSGLEEVNVMGKQVGEYAFAEMPNLTMAMADGTYAKGEFFHNASLDSVYGSPTEIREFALAQCPMLSTSAVRAAAKIGDFALADSNAAHVVLSSGLTSLGRGVFSGMTSLSDIDVKSLGSNIPDVDSSVFDGIDRSGIDLLVSDDTEDAWKAHPEWGQFKVRTGISVVIPTVDGNGKLSISIRNNTLHASSDEPIHGMEAFDEAGRKLGSVSGIGYSLSMQLPDNSRVIIVRVWGEGWKSVRKYFCL